VVSTAKYFAPGLVMRTRKAFPGLEIELKIGNRQEILDALDRDEFDLTIMGRPPREPAVTAHGLGDHPHIIVAPPDHRLAGQDSVSASDLLAETFLSRKPGSGTRILMERYLDRIGEGQTYTRYELGTNETIKQAVIAGLGIALLSAHTVTAEIESGRLVSLNAQGLPLIRQWFLVHREDRPLGPAASSVHDFLIGLDGSFLPAA
jgi:DNA-binding transcriptional LysR family regulator